MSRLAVIATLVFGLSGSLACGGRQPLDWPSVLELVRSRYPAVRAITTSQLAAWMEDGKPLILLDARTPAEYDVSHLRGALLADSETRALAALDGAARDARIVVYCSVGYRSADLASRLGDEGYTNVTNLEGSIFRWANEGRPVYAGDRQVARVHPYDDRWGTLLDEKLRWVPGAPEDAGAAGSPAREDTPAGKSGGTAGGESQAGGAGKSPR